MLHERAKKATLDHSTAFGQPKAVTAVTALDATFIGETDSPGLFLCLCTAICSAYCVAAADDEKSPFITLE